MNKNNEVTKNDKAWGQLFDKYNILKHIERKGFYEISAVQINEFREARLMTKFDHHINLPIIFSKNNLSILPITRGSYIISHFEAYKEFENTDHEVTKAEFPNYLESLDFENITSEAMAINCAYVSNILSDFLEDASLMPTVSGRMSSDKFSFNIFNTQTKSNFAVNVANSQLEIDGGYEGVKQLAIIEAKNFISKDFLIRQLYYPFRLWKNKIWKKVIPVFLVYSNGIFSLYQYEFQEELSYNSLVMVKHRNYSVENIEISLEDIINVLTNARLVTEPEIPFPQADSFERIINLCELLLEGQLSKDDITLNYAFDPRQTNYYTDAARYLGLIDKHRINGEVLFSLTQEGLSIIRLRYKARQLRFVDLILRHKVFNKTLRLCLQLSQLLPKEDIVQVMRECNLYHIESDYTFERRASTISGWINWILGLQR